MIAFCGGHVSWLRMTRPLLLLFGMSDSVSFLFPQQLVTNQMHYHAPQRMVLSNGVLGVIKYVEQHNWMKHRRHHSE